MTVLHTEAEKRRKALYSRYMQELDALLMQHNLDFARAHPDFRSIDLAVLAEMGTAHGEECGSLDSLAHALPLCRRFTARFDLLMPGAQDALLGHKPGGTPTP